MNTERKRYVGARKIAKGVLLLITSGAYSDFSIISVCLALEAFDMQELQSEYLAKHPEEAYCFSRDRFMAYLIQEGLVADADYTSVHIGDYGVCKFSVSNITGDKTEGE